MGDVALTPRSFVQMEINLLNSNVSFLHFFFITQHTSDFKSCISTFRLKHFFYSYITKRLHNNYFPLGSKAEYVISRLEGNNTTRM